MIAPSPRPTPSLLTSLTLSAGMALMAACGSSDSPGSTAPPVQRLPDEFVVFFAGYEAGEPMEPYVYDFATGESRRANAPLPNGAEIQQFNSSLSPDGTTLVVNLRDVAGVRTRVIDLETGVTRTPVFPVSNFDRSPIGEEGSAVLKFSADSNHAWINRALGGHYLSDGKGRGVEYVLVDGEQVEPHAWLGDTSRLLVRSYDSANDSERLSIVDAVTGAATNFVLAAGESVSIEEVVLSDDHQVALVSAEADGTPGGETEDVFAIDLTTGATQRWTVPGLDEESLSISHDGSYVAFVTEGTATAAPLVLVGERSTGAVETVSLPAAEPKDTRVGEMAFEPGGNRFAFISNHREVDTGEVTLVAFGTAPILIDPAASVNTNVISLGWSPNGGYLAYWILDTVNEGVFVFDADDTAAPFPVSHPVVAGTANEFAWSPLGDFLLVREGPAGYPIYVTSAYSVNDWTQRRQLGLGWRPGASSEPEDRRQLRFSKDGTRVLWRSLTSSFVEGSSLWSARLGDPDGTAPEHVSGDGQPGTLDLLGDFWLRAGEPAGS